MKTRCLWYMSIIWFLAAAIAWGEPGTLLPAPEDDLEVPSYFYQWEGSLRRLNGAQLAQEVVSIVEQLEPYTDPETEFNASLLPIRVWAGRCVAAAKAGGDLSLKTQKALQVLKRKISEARGFLKVLMQREVTFDLCVQLVSVEEELLSRLRK